MTGSEAENRVKQLVSRDPSSAYRPPSLKDDTAVDRCPRCAAPLKGSQDTSAWIMAPFLRDSLTLLGTAFGGSVGGLYAFNQVMPLLSRKVPGRPAVQIFLGAPPVILASAASGGLGAGTFPAFAQLLITTYHSTSAASHFAVSQFVSKPDEAQVDGAQK